MIIGLYGASEDVRHIFADYLVEKHGFMKWRIGDPAARETLAGPLAGARVAVPDVRDEEQARWVNERTGKHLMIELVDGKPRTVPYSAIGFRVFRHDIDSLQLLADYVIYDWKGWQA